MGRGSARPEALEGSQERQGCGAALSPLPRRDLCITLIPGGDGVVQSPLPRRVVDAPRRERARVRVIPDPAQPSLLRRQESIRVQHPPFEGQDSSGAPKCDTTRLTRWCAGARLFSALPRR